MMKKIINIIKTYKKELGGLLRHAATILGASASIAGTGWSFANKISHKKEVKVALSTDPVSGEQTRKFNEETKTWESA